MKVLIYMPFADWVTHLATDLEIAKNHLDNGDEVHIIQCSGDLPFCEPNQNHFAVRCHLCKSRRDKGLNLIKLPETYRHDLDLNEFVQDVDIPEFTTLDELKNYTIEGIDIGMAVASSLISMIREPFPDVGQYKGFIRKNIPASIAVYYAIMHHLEQINPDVFYLFNGRYSTLRPALRAAQNLSIKTFVHERAGVLQRYSLNEDTYPHDLDYMKDQIEQFWDDTRPLGEKEAIARKWFEERRGGEDQSWFSFTKSQILGNLPDGFEPKKRNIAIFVSSQDEFESISGWENPIYRDQIEALVALLKADIDSQITFYLRIHPNLKGIYNTQTKALKELRAPNLRIIPAEATIDTYSLMDACEKVITFGSTMGIESVYWGKPSILVGHALYENGGGCFMPRTHEEFIELVNSPLEPKDPTGALKYAYMQAVRGIPFNYYEPENVRGGKFMGVYLKNPAFDRLKAKILSKDLLSKIIFNSAYLMRKLTWMLH